MIEFDAEVSEVALVGSLHLSDELFFRPIFLPSANHDRRAVGIVCAKVTAVVATQFLKPHPNVRLQVLDHMANMNVTIGVRQSGSDEESTLRHKGN